MNVDELRRGLVRIVDADGSRGTGFFVSTDGKVLTCNHVVAGATEPLTVEGAGGLTAKAEPEDSSAPDIDVCVLRTGLTIPEDKVLPMEVSWGVGDRFWSAGFQLQGGSITDAFPTRGTIAGSTDVRYDINDRLYEIRGALHVADATIRPGLSGAPAVAEQSGVAIGLVNSRYKLDGGFILPFSRFQEFPKLAALLEANRRTIPRYGEFLNWAGFSRASANQVQTKVKWLEQTRRYSRSRYVNRKLIEEEIKSFLSSDCVIMPILGNTGTGKTCILAHSAEKLSESQPTVLLLAYQLSPGQGGIERTITQELKSAGISAPSAGWTFSMHGTAPGLVILFDGLNEWPGSVQSAGDWFESAQEWLPKLGAKLIVTSRPEYWSLVKPRIWDQDFLYQSVEEVPHKDGAKSSKKEDTRVDEFSADEVGKAAERYGIVLPSGSEMALRHPFFFQIWSASHPGKSTAPRPNELFAIYLAKVINGIRAKTPGIPSEESIRVKLMEIAGILEKKGSLWLTSEEFFGLFPGDRALADGLLSEHLVITGADGLRFGFDEVAYFVVAQHAIRKSGGNLSRDWLKQLLSAQPPLFDAIPFVAAELEASGSQDALGEMLANMAALDPENPWRAYDLYQSFLRTLQWLDSPGRHFGAVRILFEAVDRDEFFSDAYRLGSLSELPGFDFNQRLEILRALALRQSDYPWRWKDWSGLSSEEFWSGRFVSVVEFKSGIRRSIEQEGADLIDALVDWTTDDTLLRTNSPPAEARLGDLVCGILLHVAADWYPRIADGLAGKLRNGQSPLNVSALLRALAKHRPEIMLGVLERWVELPDDQYGSQAAMVARELLDRSAQKEQVAGALDRLLANTTSPWVQRDIADTLSYIPGRIDQVLGLVATLRNGPAPLRPWIFSALSQLDGERATRELLTEIDNSRDLGWTEEALGVLGDMRMPPSVNHVVLEWLMASHEKLGNIGNKYGVALEGVIYRISLTAENAGWFDGLVRNLWRTCSEAARLPIAYAVMTQAESGAEGLAALRAAIELETSEKVLVRFLDGIPWREIPFEDAVASLRAAARKMPGTEAQNIRRAILLPASHTFREELADLIAKNPGSWPDELRNFSAAVKTGERSFDAALKMLRSNRAEGG